MKEDYLITYGNAVVRVLFEDAQKVLSNFRSHVVDTNNLQEAKLSDWQNHVKVLYN